LRPDERRSIANYTSAGKDVSGQISDQYSLSIKSASAVKTIDGQALRTALARVEKVEEKAVRSWTVDDRSFCP
jgi:cell division ATPase FtsA